MTTYLLSPFRGQGLNNTIFDGPYNVLRSILADRDINLITIDLGDIKDTSKVLFFDLNNDRLKQCIDAGLTLDRLILLLFEPEAVRPDQYEPEVWKSFGKILTWRDDLVDNVRCFKFRHPQGQHLQPILPRFDERKLAVMINANKYSYVEGEGYSYRRKAIRYFDSCGEFDLYGHNWNNAASSIRSATIAAIKSRKLGYRYFNDICSGYRSFRSYSGSIPDKYHTLAQFKFCLCYENQLNRPGYITEKLFDCFFCGTIPIYLGATNIVQHIPRDCFIWMKDIPNFKALDELMRSMTSEQFASIQQAGQDFIRSEAFHKWSPEGVFGDIANCI